MHFTSAALITLAAALTAVDAHAMLGTPVPFGKSTLNNSPLSPDGSDYPCKLRSGAFDPEGAQNTVAAGGSLTMSFIGSAVHGGGSCQVSLTKDNPPTKDSVFKVIHSIIGGCPAAADGNLGNDPSSQASSDFQVPIPSDVEAGEYVFAWTWFNKIGNREMYMNCAPLTITGGGAAKRARSLTRRQGQSGYDSLPEMFKANIGGDCTTLPLTGHDVIFPNPGSSVEKLNVPGPALPPQCASGAGAGSGDAPVVETPVVEAPVVETPVVEAPVVETPVIETPVVESPVVDAPAGGSPNGYGYGSADAPVAEVPSEVSPAPTAEPTTYIPPVDEAPAPQPTADAPTESPAANTPDDGVFVEQPTAPAPLVSEAQTGPCPSEGAFVCLNNGKSFQRCASGVWSVPMQMAAGTTCAVSGSYMEVGTVKHKRNLRFSVGHGHLRRRHASI